MKNYVLIVIFGLLIQANAGDSFAGGSFGEFPTVISQIKSGGAITKFKQGLVSPQISQTIKSIISNSEKHNEFWYTLDLSNPLYEKRVNLYFVASDRRIPDQKVSKFLETGASQPGLSLRDVAIFSKNRKTLEIVFISSEKKE